MHSAQGVNKGVSHTEGIVSREGLKGWMVVLGAIAGLAVGNLAINLFAFSILLKPTSEATGLSRSDITFAYFVGTMVSALVLPFYGRLVDRYGVRVVSVPAIIAYAITIAGFALLSTNAAWLIVLLYVAGGIFGVAACPLPYSKAIASWFGARRGLALGIGVSGVGLGGFLMPQFAQALNAAYGWRIAYLGLGLAVLLIAIPTMTFLVNTRDESVAAHAGDHSQPSGGLKLAMQKRQFWLLAVYFFVSILALYGTVPHLVAMLTDRGMAAQDAASVLSTAGGALVVARMVCGYLLDRFHGPYVACFILLIPMLGLLGLANDARGVTLLACAIGLGIGMGGETDVLGYLTSRYFDPRSFGEVYGVLFALVGAGSAVGPFLMGFAHDRLGDYHLALICAAVSLGACATLSLTLGRYPTNDFRKEQHVIGS